MAKVTDLTTSGTPDAADVLPIVDVSDTTMAASGTTKKVTVTTLKAGLGLPSPAYTAATNLTAAGSSQSDALAITSEVNDVTTTAASTGVRLAAYSAAGVRQTVNNRGANTLKVYPPTGGSINSLPTNAAFSLPAGCTVTLVWVSSSLLISMHVDGAQLLTTVDNSSSTFPPTAAQSVVTANNTNAGAHTWLALQTSGTTVAAIRADASGGLSLHAGTGQSLFGFIAGTALYQANSTGFFPSTTNSIPCGKSGQLWTAVWATNGTIQTSDESEKKDIGATPLGLDFILLLKPKQWRWREGGRDLVKDGDLERWEIRPGKRLHHGLLADDVVAALESAGKTTDDFGGFVDPSVSDPSDAAPKGLNYSQFIAPLIRAVQELSEQNKQLRTRVDALEKRR